jgi:hypothetical protein
MAIQAECAVALGRLTLVPDLLGDGVVEPGDDAGVDLEPLGVIEHGSGIHGAVDVIEQPELLDGEFDERPPLPEVALIGREDDGNVASDVQHHQGGGRRWSGISERIGV